MNIEDGSCSDADSCASVVGVNIPPPAGCQVFDTATDLETAIKSCTGGDMLNVCPMTWNDTDKNPMISLEERRTASPIDCVVQCNSTLTDHCIFDGGAARQIMRIDALNIDSLEFDGFIFRKGHSGDGAAIFAKKGTSRSSYLTIKNSEFLCNDSTGIGAAMYINDSQGNLASGDLFYVSITDSVFRANRARGSEAGAILANPNFNSLTLGGNTFDSNIAKTRGGAMALKNVRDEGLQMVCSDMNFSLAAAPRRAPMVMMSIG